MDSIFVFVVHRGASGFIHNKISKKVAKELNLYLVNVGNELYRQKLNANETYRINSKGMMYSRIYTKYMKCLDISSIRRGVCILRDPRDVAVSMFFSWAYSHPLNPGEDPEKRNLRQMKLREMGIRNWLEREGLLQAKEEFDYGRTMCSVNPHISKLHYESMVTDWKSFFMNFVSDLQLDGAIDTSQYDYSSEFYVEEEDIYKKKRRVIPGNWKEVFTPRLCKLSKDMFGSSLEEESYGW